MMPTDLEYVEAILLCCSVAITVACVRFLRWCWRIYREDLR
jgi:hypothetical protein